jgi:hypothetical protein
MVRVFCAPEPDPREYLGTPGQSRGGMDFEFHTPDLRGPLEWASEDDGFRALNVHFQVINFGDVELPEDAVDGSGGHLPIGRSGATAECRDAVALFFPAFVTDFPVFGPDSGVQDLTPGAKCGHVLRRKGGVTGVHFHRHDPPERVP